MAKGSDKMRNLRRRVASDDNIINIHKEVNDELVRVIHK